ncbi:MAG: rhomboid protease GluP [Planctomycetota bacterium]|jgi:rhomboid protease GluP
METDENTAHEVFAAPTKRGLRDAELTLVALGIPHGQHYDGFLWRLMVSGIHVEQALDELRDLVVENKDWPPRVAPPPILSNGKLGALVYAAVIAIFHPIGQVGLFGLNWWDPGKVDAARIRSGEIWRTATALTLHGDIAHLAANLVFGIGFGVLASHTLGAGLAWLATLIAGMLGNYANAWLADPSHTAIGASTAVFATLGLLSMYEWVRRSDLGLRQLRRAAPLIAGAVLLGFLGAGGGESGPQNIDVGAHVLGFIAGGLVGFVLGRYQVPTRLSSKGQVRAGLLGLALVAAAWVAALTLGS